ncbi:MAG: SsrA-binding protein SmpB, partial [Patescibacteria group bacterium]
QMPLAQNKKVEFEYEILEKYEAGLVLSGQEVKSVKLGQINLKGSYITFHGPNAYVLNMHINKYKAAGPLPDYDPTQSRRILLHKKQIAYLKDKSMMAGLTIVPLRVYTKGRLLKIEVAVARGKKLYDKREVLKKRELKREIDRARKN